MKFAVILLVGCVAAIQAQYTGPINQAGLDLIKEFEGWYPDFYTDPVGIRTIGYGHACHVWDCSVPLNGKYPVPLSLAHGEALLQDDLSYPGSYEQCVASYVTYNGLNANQYSALVSFAFNIGCGGLQSSTLLARLNAGDVIDASTEFSRWINGGGQVLPGLIRRREAERVLFCTGGICNTGCTGTVNADNLNVRVNPSASSSQVDQISRGTSVHIYKKVSGDNINGNPWWFQIGKGYVSAYYIDLVSTTPTWCSK